MNLYGKEQARRSLFDTVVFRALSQAATMLGYVVLVRGMAEENFGIYNLLYAFVPVVSTVLSLGLEQVLRRYQPEYLSLGNYAAAGALLRFIASARFGANLVLVAVIMVCWNWVAPTFQLGPYRAQFLLFTLILLLHFQTVVLELALASHMLQRYALGMWAGLSIIKLLAYAVLIWTGGLTLERAICADILAYACTYAGMRFVYQRHCRTSGAGQYKFRPAERRRMIRYGLFNNFNDVGSLALNSRIDNFYIAAFVNALAVGAYSFYTRLNEMLVRLMPIRLFENVITPVFFAIRAEHAEQRVPGYFSFLVNINLFVQLPVLAFSIAYHREIVAVVFGGKFIEYSMLLPAVVAFATANVIETPVALVAQLQERAAIILGSKIFALLNILTMLTLLPMLGLPGAVISTGSMQLLKNLFIWWHVRRVARWLHCVSVIATGAAIWGLFIGFAYLARHYLPVADVVQLAIGVIIAAATAFLALRTPLLSRSDREILAAVLHGKENRWLKMAGVVQ